ncbi:MAG: AAA family ATPase [Chloroflexi bacterium]|nr:AAA family ATPase [Chloroflexota bacterium]
MLTKIQIKNFRCFRELEIAPLRRINLITGQNNTGKTALLEALMLMLAQPDPSACGNLPNEFRAGVGRAAPQENFWD